MSGVVGADRGTARVGRYIRCRSLEDGVVGRLMWVLIVHRELECGIVVRSPLIGLNVLVVLVCRMGLHTNQDTLANDFGIWGEKKPG